MRWEGAPWEELTVRRKEDQQPPRLQARQERDGECTWCPWGELLRWPLGAEACLGGCLGAGELGMMTVDNFLNSGVNIEGFPGGSVVKNSPDNAGDKRDVGLLPG